MKPLRKAVKKTLIETDTTAKLLEALTDHDPKDIVSWMAKNQPRTLLDVIKRISGESVEEEEVYTPGTPKGRTDWDDIKEALEALYETGDYTYETLIDAALDMTEGEIDRYTAEMLVNEIFI